MKPGKGIVLTADVDVDAFLTVLKKKDWKNKDPVSLVNTDFSQLLQEMEGLVKERLLKITDQLPEVNPEEPRPS